MTDDYKKGLVTGLAMQPLCVSVSSGGYIGSGLQVAEGIAAKLLPANIIIVQEATTE